MHAGKLRSAARTVTASPVVRCLGARKHAARAASGEGNKCEPLGSRSSGSQDQTPEVARGGAGPGFFFDERKFPQLPGGGGGGQRTSAAWEHGGSAPSADGGEVHSGGRWHRGRLLRGAGRAVGRSGGQTLLRLPRPRRWRRFGLPHLPVPPSPQQVESAVPLPGPPLDASPVPAPAFFPARSRC